MPRTIPARRKNTEIIFGRKNISSCYTSSTLRERTNFSPYQMDMTPFSPIETAVVILLGLLFASLFIAWCCKQCSQSKQSIAPLLCPQDTLYNRQYMTAVDVQTGQPVIIQTVGRSSRNLVRITSVTSDRRHLVNPSIHTTTYGSIAHNNPQCIDIISRTPPPPYSEVCAQPQR